MKLLMEKSSCIIERPSKLEHLSSFFNNLLKNFACAWWDFSHKYFVLVAIQHVAETKAGFLQYS